MTNEIEVPPQTCLQGTLKVAGKSEEFFIITQDHTDIGNLYTYTSNDGHHNPEHKTFTTLEDVLEEVKKCIKRGFGYNTSLGYECRQ